MRATLLAHSVRIQPGVPATLDIEVTNTSDVIDGISAEVYGLDPAWVPLVQPVVTLFPDTSGTLTIRFILPTSCVAGESMITVRVFSTIDDRRHEEHPVWITVEPVEAATLEMRPSLVEGGTHAEMRAVITNTGNVATEFSVTALEPTRALECSVVPPTVLVEPGQQGEVVMYAEGRRPFIGQVLSRNIEITATSPNLELTQSARFMQKPRIPRGLITALILALIIVLWATIFLLVVQYMRSRAAPAKAVPATWAAGTREVKISDVAASLGGTVVAASNSQGLARITVEAWRKTKGTYEAAASAVTGDDGTFTLGALLPGTYKVKFSADGFDTVWNSNAATEATAPEISVNPLATLTGINAVITGKSGTLIGQVAAPQGNGAAPATVTVTLIPANTSQKVPAPQVLTTNGPFTVTGLTTPATYEVSVARPGFDPQVSRVDLNGGQSGVLDTASLAAANGSIKGRVVDGAGNGLGNVKVVLRSGAIEKSIVTPTVGDVGSYTLDGLPTPRTYVITFTLDGFTSATVALDLSGGENKEGINAQLIGGAGTIIGTARDVNNNRLGGVKVVVTKGAIRAETATLTTGGGPTGTGSYSVSNLPVPGLYTVTFSLDGYQSETRQIDLLGATATPPVVDIVLHLASSTLNGTVHVTGGQANLNVGLTVELSDGSTVRTAVTTSTPAGFYSFAGVPEGTYTLRVFGAGVVQRVVRISTVEGVDVTRDITTAAS